MSARDPVPQLGDGWAFCAACGVAIREVAHLRMTDGRLVHSNPDDCKRALFSAEGRR